VASSSARAWEYWGTQLRGTPTFNEVSDSMCVQIVRNRRMFGSDYPRRSTLAQHAGLPAYANDVPDPDAGAGHPLGDQLRFD